MADLEKLLRPSIGRNIALSVEFADPIYPIFADLTQFNQTIVNLCVNAQDAMPSGGSLTIRISTTLLTETTLLEKQGVRPGPFVRIEVTDTGSGIPPKSSIKFSTRSSPPRPQTGVPVWDFPMFSASSRATADSSTWKAPRRSGRRFLSTSRSFRRHFQRPPPTLAEAEGLASVEAALLLASFDSFAHPQQGLL